MSLIIRSCLIVTTALGATSALADRSSLVRGSGDLAAATMTRSTPRVIEAAQPRLITTAPIERPANATGMISHDLVSTAKPGQSAFARSPQESRLMQTAQAHPTSGRPLPGLNNDRRFHAADGWQKRTLSERPAQVHYQYNPVIDKVADVKAVGKAEGRATPPVTQTQLQPIAVNQRWK